MIKFPVCIRWDAANQEWRVLSFPKKTHLWEIPVYPRWWRWLFKRLRLFHCEFIDEIVRREGLSKTRDNIVYVSFDNQTREGVLDGA